MDVPYFLSKYVPDPLRFYLTATAPKTRDTKACPERSEGPALLAPSVVEGSPWEDFVERNNPVPSFSPEQREGASEGNELVATWGNLGHRPRVLGFAREDSDLLSFATKRFDGVVPEPGELDAEDRTLLEKVEAGFETVGEQFNAWKFRAPLNSALALAREANGYLDRKASWFQIREEPQAAATNVYVILRVVGNLKTILPHTPVLAHRTQRLHEYLGYKRQLFGTQHVVEYEEETRSHAALTHDHAGAIGYTFATLSAGLGAERAAGGPGAAPAGVTVQEAG